MTEKPHTHIRLRHLRRHLRVGTLGWNINAALKLLQRRASSREGYLRDVAGAVQALQRMLPTSQKESAAPQPAPRATGILRLLARGTPKARCREMPSVSPRGSRREMGRPQARPKAKPLLLPLFSPHPLRAPVRRGWELQGGRSLRLPSARVLPLAPANQRQGEEFKPRRKGRGEQRRGHLPRPLPLGKKKKKKNHQGTRRKTRRAEDAEGAGSTPETAVLRSPLRASAPPAAGQRDSEGFPVAHQLTWSDCVCAERSTQPGRRRGGRTHGLSAARRGAASPRRCSASSGGCGRRAGNAAASSACEAGRRTRRGENPPSSPPSPGPSLAPPSPPPASPYLTPLAVTNLPPCPRLAGKRERGGTQGPGSLSWGAGRGGRRAPLPGREAVLKLGIRSVILEPGSNPDCPPPSCRKQNPFARMPSSPVSPPLQIEMVQAPGAPAPRELESGVRLAGLPSGPNTK